MNTIYALLISIVVGFGGGVYFESLRWDKSMKEIIEANYIGIKNNDIIKEKIVTKYIDRVRVVEKRTTEYVNVAKEVVGPDMSIGFVELHNAAAEKRDPVSALISNGETSRVTSDEAAETIARNYGTYYRLYEQIIGLQEYVTTTCK
jgi:hypothetical protein